MRKDQKPAASFSEPEAQRILSRAAELEVTLRSGFPGLLRELGIVFGSFTAAIGAVEGFTGASAAMTWSLMAGALACGIRSLRGTRPPDPVNETATSESR
jgi:hypothetical protein